MANESGKERPREKTWGASTGALAFPCSASCPIEVERHSHYKQRGVEPLYKKGPAERGPSCFFSEGAVDGEGIGSNHRAAIPILTREFGSELLSGVGDRAVALVF